MTGKSNRIIVTVIGVDKVGIIAQVSAVLAEANANIVDISQTTLREFFTMIMMADLEKATRAVRRAQAPAQRQGRRDGPARSTRSTRTSSSSCIASERAARPKSWRFSFPRRRSSRPSAWCRWRISTSAPSRWASACATAPTRTSRRPRDKAYDKICRSAARLVAVGEEIEREYGIPIINKRVSVTPIALVAESGGERRLRAVRAGPRARGAEVGVNFLGGFSALVHKGTTPGDARADRLDSRGARARPSASARR